MTQRTEHVVDQLSPYLDGELGTEASARVRAHLGGCAACAQAAAEFQTMVRASRTLERPEPPPTLWPSIEGALAWRQVGDGAFGWRIFAGGLFAGAAVALGVVWIGSSGLARRGAPAAPTAVSVVAPSPAASDPLLAEAEGEFERAAAAYERSIEKLRGLLAREQSLWSVDERVRYADRLSRLDEAIVRSRETARQRPGDAAGNELLFAAYQKKIEFLAAAVHRGAPGLGGNGP